MRWGLKKLPTRKLSITEVEKDRRRVKRVENTRHGERAGGDSM